jgi:hypothetical protein
LELQNPLESNSISADQTNLSFLLFISAQESHFSFLSGPNSLGSPPRILSISRSNPVAHWPTYVVQPIQPTPPPLSSSSHHQAVVASGQRLSRHLPPHAPSW